ncbi:MAG: hypothetical protein J6U54_08830 [Clostridiales bacterium]|nr:hypothetical protein [Clostridiales bacterium]
MATELRTSADFYFLNQNFEAVHKLTQFESLMWVDKYDEPGSFEIYAPPLPEIKEAAQINNYFTTTKSDRMMIVEELETTVTPEGGRRLVIRGRSLESILDRRVIFLKCYFRDDIPDPDPEEGQYGSNNLEDAVRQILDFCCIHPKTKDDTTGIESPDTDREMPLVFQYSAESVPLRDNNSRIIVDENDEIVLTDSLESEPIDEIQLKDCEFEKGTDVLTIVETIVKSRGLGFKITLGNNNNFVFRLIKGKKRTSDQSEHPMVIFSPRFNNIKNTKFTESYSANYKNFVYTEGETYKSKKPTIVKTGETTGLLRREVYVESEVTHETEADNVTQETIEKVKKTLSEDEYQEVLAKDAEKYFRKYQPKTECESEVEPNLTFQYGRDFDIGDILEVQDGTGNKGKVRCKEFIISFSDSGYEEYPTFDNYDEEDDEPAQATASGGEFTDGNTGGGINIREQLLEMCYPVGCIYTSTQNVSPESFLGGTWISLDDYVLRAADGTTNVVTPNQNLNDGGADAAEITSVASHNHTQNSHNHTQNAHKHGLMEQFGAPASTSYPWNSGPYQQLSMTSGTNNSASCYNTTATNIATTATNIANGATFSINTIPKYKNVYMWERIA